MTRRKPALSLALVSLLLAVRAEPQEAANAQEQALLFPARVEQVTVDVVVIDKKTKEPVTDLTRDDIEIYENGIRQPVASFDAFRAPAAPAAEVAPEAEAAPLPVPPPRVSTNQAGEQRYGRTFVILLDDVHLTAYTAHQAKAAVASFLKSSTREGDLVTLVAAAGGAWWGARMEAGRDELLDIVRRMEGRLVPDKARERMSDYEAMRIHVFRDEMMMNRVQRRFETYGLQTLTGQSQHVTGPRAYADPYVTARAAEIYYTATTRNRVTLQAMERALGALVDVKGRKSMILVSGGFIYDPHLDEFKGVLDAARRANTAIYFVNGRGLEGLPSAMDAEYSTVAPQEDLGFAFSEEFETAEGSTSLALDSGGFVVRNSNDLAGGLQRIADETSAYYLVGYTPTNPARDGRFREIEVKVRGRKGVEIRARRGYYAPSDEEAASSARAEGDPVFQKALDSPYEIGDIPLRMTQFVREETLFGKARVYVAAEVDIRSLRFEEGDARAVGSLQFLLVTIHRESGEFLRYDQKVDLKLGPETRERLDRTWLPIVREFELSPGRYRAKIVVRDGGTGRLGTLTHDFEVPVLRDFRVSTPVLSDLSEVNEQSGQQLALMARRDFPQGESLFCQLDVFGAARLEDSGMPRVSMGYEVRRRDGTLFTGESSNVINPTDEGRLSRMIGFSLEGAEPGDYVIVVRVRDELSGRSLDLREPFRVTAPLPPAAVDPGTPTAATGASPGGG